MNLRVFILLSIIIPVAVCNTFAQDSDPFEKVSQKLVSIYEYGEPLISCEANFKNLVANWNDNYVENVGNLELISYSYVETIKDSLQIKKYESLLFAPESRLGNTNQIIPSIITDEDRYRISLNVTKYAEFEQSQLFFSKNKQETRKNLESIKKKIVDSLLGTKVYVVTIKDEAIFENYVFCDPTTQKVVWDNLFSNVKIIPKQE